MTVSYSQGAHGQRVRRAKLNAMRNLVKSPSLWARFLAWLKA